MKSSNSGILIVAVLVLAVVVLLSLSASPYMMRYAYSNPIANGMMGYGSNMMQYYWSNHSSNYAYLNSSQLNRLAASESVPSKFNGTLYFNGSNVRIVVLMGPMEEGQSMYSFVVDNMTNPNLEFRKGANVTLFVVNIDTDAYHSLTLTTQQPPYSYYTMPMMMNSYGTSMMLAPQRSGVFIGQSASFVANQDMYYICTVAGHAQKGMFGRIIVE